MTHSRATPSIPCRDTTPPKCACYFCVFPSPTTGADGQAAAPQGATAGPQRLHARQPGPCTGAGLGDGCVGSTPQGDAVSMHPFGMDFFLCEVGMCCCQSACSALAWGACSAQGDAVSTCVLEVLCEVGGLLCVACAQVVKACRHFASRHNPGQACLECPSLGEVCEHASLKVVSL